VDLLLFGLGEFVGNILFNCRQKFINADNLYPITKLTDEISKVIGADCPRMNVDNGIAVDCCYLGRLRIYDCCTLRKSLLGYFLGISARMPEAEADGYKRFAV
jgi:hypothetical protein